MDASVNRIASSKDERAYLIGVRIKGESADPVEYSLEELTMLVTTAGAVPVGSRIVHREKIDPSFIVGRGFVDEMKGLIDELRVTLFVFDLNNIRPAQVRNLEETLKCRILGRSEIILDIFARRARSSEAQIQVELAQLRYILPRLKGLGGVLSRLGGGIGTRGPGEKMLETDRRHILRRINTLSKKLDRIERHRQRTRKGRAGQVTGSVVGYTNAGKSTLINVLARDDLFVENRLFATLDSFTRRVYLGDAKEVLLTDTVGFIRNLPANLIESFRSTLEEIAASDFILHVIDITAPDIETNIKTVNDEIVRLNAQDKPVIHFFNKSDLLDPDGIDRARAVISGSLAGSAVTGENIPLLKEALASLSDYIMSRKV
ncbi:MAG TPA: GTPase HflX [Spirochaetota bacterium]|nr:GTPase HflX [Spirochaetota bacterium]HPI90926.1 GTPase HflX [Spirochaetota bacterium]HPR48398.1 GTPase HflX [Spirochaetota bacterium]